MTHSTKTPGRNAPCPCGSGRKYKRCCGEGKAPSPGPAWFSKPIGWVLLGCLVIVLAMAAAANLAGQTESDPAASSSTPQPWEYDQENNRHWHPGHAHWHLGPPPDSADSPGAIPSPAQ